MRACYFSSRCYAENVAHAWIKSESRPEKTATSLARQRKVLAADCLADLSLNRLLRPQWVHPQPAFEHCLHATNQMAKTTFPILPNSEPLMESLRSKSRYPMRAAAKRVLVNSIGSIGA